MKIAWFGVTDEEKKYVKEDSVEGASISFFEEKLDETSAAKANDADVLSVFVSSQVSKNIIDALPNLKLIATRSTGFDHIDLDYTKSKGIKVANVPAYGSHTVAEFAFGLILNLSRKILQANNAIRETTDFKYFPMMEGFDLAGKTLGVVGTGKIGKNVVKIAKGFGMNVIASDPYPDLAFAKENGLEYKSLNEVLGASDVITLHAPYMKENHHLINMQNVSMIKKGAYLINTARGELMETDALVYGLKEGIIAGAGLDVLEGEPDLKQESEILASPSRGEVAKDYKMLLEDHMLMEMPNVIVTPHIAFYTKEAVATIVQVTLDNTKAFASNSPTNLVN